MTGDRSIDSNDDDGEEEESGPQHARVVSTSSSVGTASGTDDDATTTTNDVALVVTPNSTTTTTATKSSSKGADSSSVQVAVRVRPLLSSLESGCGSCIQILPTHHHHLDHDNSYPTTIQIGPESGPTFTFDEVFPTTTTQLHVFEHRVAPLVERCLEGYNATILAYGQTGSGKTHTVIGPSTCHSTPEDESSGMIPRAVSSLFHQLQRKKVDMAKQQQKQQSSSASPSKAIIKQQEQQPDPPSSSNKSPASSPSRPNKSTGKDAQQQQQQQQLSFEFQVRVQFLELYGEEIRDLLTTSSSTNSAGERLTIRDIGNDEPEVVGATSQVVASAEEALRCLTKGMLRRVTAATAMNESSSRSHAIFSILMDQTWTTTSSSDSSNNNINDAVAVGPQVRRSKFNFVDLAGSERQKRTRAEGRRLKEGIDINKGLLVLGNVISALGDPKKRGKAFVPYRDSKLTRLLKGSLGGNHKTLMIACVSPSSTNMEESLNCLRYANRAKNIQNRAVVNMDARSRMIAELKTQVQALAKDLLRVKETGDPRDGVFTREALVTLVNGGSASAAVTAVGASGSGSSSNAAAMAPTKKQSVPVTPALRTTTTSSSSATTTTTTPLPSHAMLSPESTDNGMLQQRLTDTEEELEHMRNQLKRCRRESLIIEERLHVTQAEKEFYRLQLEAVGDSENAGDNKNKNTKSSSSRKMQIDQLFLNRATAYEKEIGRLKEELRVVRGQVDSTTRRLDDSGPTFSIEKANQAMQAERERLATIQTELLSMGGPPPQPPKKSPSPTKLTTTGTSSTGDEMMNDTSADVDSEARAEEEHVTALTLKYSHMEDEDEVMLVDRRDTPRSMAANSDMEQTSEHRRAKIEADLLEISRVIESKEELISQLQCSQAKYSSMREFYEGKLHEMELLLNQKEEERQKIIVELERLKENNHDTRELEEQLKKKEEHIAGIRKQKLQLKDLTAVSSRNATEIKKLQNDVRAMKEKKVSMQKQLTEERKAHAMEIKMLKKEVLQKDRETRKWQKTANQKASEAEKANQVAKMKVQQLGQLRAKYKDAEKTIRMLQIKKGVMAKAGLDSVIVGRRGAEKKKDQNRNPASQGRSVDADSLRDYFDRKVAEVGRKEALADKLARGWEEHMQLTLQRAELEDQDPESSKEEIQALDLRIQYEEDRIRKLAHRLGKKQPSSDSGDDAEKPGNPNSILYGKDFEKICNGASPAKASEIAAKVLFGMVVRERRRIASLAKTASSLDEKLQECQMDNEAKEVAFRSYVQDSQQDFANISMNHQEQILSLMSLVKGGGDNPGASNGAADSTTIASTDGESTATEMTESSKLLVLANERVAALEQQLRELKTENRVSESYRLEKEETKKELAAKIEEYEKLEVRLAALRASLRRVRDHITDAKNDGNTADSDLSKVFGSCLGIIREALLESPGPMSPRARARRHSCPNVFHPTSFSPQSQKQWEFIQLAADDDEEEEETPDWADEIMADLALIAEGQLPPSLRNIPDMPDMFLPEKDLPKAIPEMPDLFMPEILVTKPNEEKKPELRVRSPPRQTGIPKPRVSSPKNRPNSNSNIKLEPKPAEDPSSSSEDSLLPDNLGFLASRKATPSKSKHVQLPSDDEIHPSSSLKSEGSITTRGSRDAVFERLGDPSHFTGIEKEKHYSQADARQEHQDSAADRMLDHLLESSADLFGSRSEEVGGRRSSDSSKDAASEVVNKVKEYTSKNVFERLQKTTTQSFAGKHPPHHHEAPHSANDGHSSQGTLGHKQEPAKRSSLEGRARRVAPDQHTTDANPKTFQMHKSPSRNKFKARSVMNRNKSPQKAANPRSSSPTRTKSPARQRKEDYANLPVFERLTKTTTEAYAVKKRVVKN